MTYRLLFARDEMKKRHFIFKNKDKTSKTMKNANCDVNGGANVKMPYSLHVGYVTSMCNKEQHHCILRCRPMLR